MAMFTDGKLRKYEALMQEIPHYTPMHSGRRNEPFTYKYADMDCDYCLYCRKCKFGICPHIMAYLSDLQKDPAFHHAVATAETCENGHRKTLLQLKKNGITAEALC
jgi:hypothetical protein